MYSHCIYCSAALGTNAAVERFPVGRSLAFDAWTGRLWAVCPKCGRWNLAPIEERWEAVEEAERLFRESRRRVQSENIGLARLADGTHLVRVGKTLPGELAAWRYGDELVRRRRRSVLRVASRIALLDWGVLLAVLDWRDRRHAVLYRMREAGGPARTELQLQGRHLDGASFSVSGVGDSIRLSFPQSIAVERDVTGFPVEERPGPPVTLEGETAHAVLSRAMLHVNHGGASRRSVQQAVALLERAETATRFLAQLAATPGQDLTFEHSPGQVALIRTSGATPSPSMLPAAEALALEMALHDEAERRALQGDLARLEAAWREADEIARIADAL